jgi:NAD(P)-dependent dehydrogenase (short-subunit alcohol dehydrogenase family)
MTITTPRDGSPSGFARYPSLAARSVLVTGGASGIGADLVEQFVLQGARVGFSDIAALDAAIETIRRSIGPITVLLNNAANDERHGIEQTTPESWDAGIAVNLKHQFFAARNVARDMKAAGGGSIVNFGSISWMLKQGGMPVYTTSKAAVQGLTRSLARDLGPFNIRVNTLVPGWVMTDKQLRHRLDAQGRAEIARGQCLQQPLLPEHIARMALFLAADDSAMCTGQDFVVDGGWT